MENTKNSSDDFSPIDLLVSENVDLYDHQQMMVLMNNMFSSLKNPRGKLASLILFGSRIPDMIEIFGKIQKVDDFDSNSFQKLSYGMEVPTNTVKVLTSTRTSDLNNKAKINSFINKVKIAYSRDVFVATRYLSNINKANNQIRASLSALLAIENDSEMTDLIEMDARLQKEIIFVTKSLRMIISAEKNKFMSILKTLRDRLLKDIQSKGDKKINLPFLRLSLTYLGLSNLILGILLICALSSCCLLIFMLVINSVKEDPLGSAMRYVQTCGVQSVEDCLKNRGSDVVTSVLENN